MRIAVAFYLCLQVHAAPEDVAIPAESVRAAAKRSVALLQSVQARWNQNCFSCHNQNLPSLAISEARAAGLAVDEPLAQKTAARNWQVFASLEDAVDDRFAIDPALSTGFAMVAGHASGVEPSLPLAVHAYRIGRHQRDDGHWATFDGRPPSSYSLFASTAFALRALELYSHASVREESRARIERARRWLLSHKARSTEDLSMKLLGLYWSGATRDEMGVAARELQARQNKDGGWGQLAGDPSDAYATGESLYALIRAGAFAENSAERSRAVRYLLSTQKPDGSWRVRTRIHARLPVSPPYFESGFPYGKDQFISCAATGWSLMALAASLPRAANPFKSPSVDAANPKGVEPWMESALFGSRDELARLLDAGLSPNAKSASGFTLLMFSAHDPEKVKLLLSRGADAKARAKSGYDALLVASLYPGNSETLTALLDAGTAAKPPANVRFRAKPLVLAAMNGDPSMIDVLVRRGADPRAMMLLLGTVQVRPLDAATGFEHLAATEALVRHGVKPDEATPGEPSMLALSAVSHKVESVRLLIGMGADPNRRDKTGYNAFQHAESIRYAAEETLEALRESRKHSGRVDTAARGNRGK